MELNWAFSRERCQLGIAIAANRPMMATTIMISTSVKADLRLALSCMVDLSVFSSERIERNRMRLGRARLIHHSTHSHRIGHNGRFHFSFSSMPAGRKKAQAVSLGFLNRGSIRSS
jgi:hypothetical protein